MPTATRCPGCEPGEVRIQVAVGTPAYGGYGYHNGGGGGHSTLSLPPSVFFVSRPITSIRFNKLSPVPSPRHRPCTFTAIASCPRPCGGRNPQYLLDAWLWSRLLARVEMRTLRDPVVMPRWDPGPVVVSPVPRICMLRLSQVRVRVALGKNSVYDRIAGRDLSRAGASHCARTALGGFRDRSVVGRAYRAFASCGQGPLRELPPLCFPPPVRRRVSARRSPSRSDSKRRRQ